LVTGLRLEDSDVGEFFCESCAYGEMTRTQLQKYKRVKEPRYLGKKFTPIYGDLLG